jgi:hypothetical protein
MILALASTVSVTVGIISSTKVRAGMARLRTSGAKEARRSATSLLGRVLLILVESPIRYVDDHPRNALWSRIISSRRNACLTLCEAAGGTGRVGSLLNTLRLFLCRPRFALRGHCALLVAVHRLDEFDSSKAGADQSSSMATLLTPANPSLPRTSHPVSRLSSLL